MEVPISDPEPLREPLPQFECGLCDREVVHKMAQILLLGLATACVDATTGDLFRSPISVAVDIRRELVDYLTLRSETFVSDTLLRDDDGADPEPPSDHPTDIVADLAEDFAASKRNLLGRVSGWLLSESREDKIDDFVQELETNAFWFVARREAVAETLLRNVDFRNEFRCVARFDDEQALADHRASCPFRLVACSNDGCKVSCCASHAARHDEECPYKVLGCEQGCGEIVVRREMDRHCITVCSMKLVNCTFHPVGCRTTVPRCGIAKHCGENLHSHVVYVLQKMRKVEEATEEMKDYAMLLEKYQSDNELSEALDVRSLTTTIKRLEPKVKKLKDERKQAEQIEGRLQEKKSEGGQGEDHLQEKKTENDHGDSRLQEKEPEGDHVEGLLQANKTEGDQDGGPLLEKKLEGDQGEHFPTKKQEGGQGRGHSQEKELEGDHDYDHLQEKTIERNDDQGHSEEKKPLIGHGDGSSEED